MRIDKYYYLFLKMYINVEREYLVNRLRSLNIIVKIQ